MVLHSSIHLGNIANMAYGYCKLLIKHDFEVTLHATNEPHPLSQPEWLDLELKPDDFTDALNFYHNKIDLGNYQRPAWYHSNKVMGYDHPLFSSIYLRLPVPIRKRLRPLAEWAWSHVNKALSWLQQPKEVSEYWNKRIDHLVHLSKQYEPKWQLSSKDCAIMLPQAHWLDSLPDQGSIIFAYRTLPMAAMLVGKKPYVAVELGTMRELLSPNTIMGRLLALSYRQAAHVIITNPDAKQDADALGIKHYSFCPHPLDEDFYKPVSDEVQVERIRLKLHFPKGYDVYIFAPARQNWVIKGNQKYLEAFAKLRQRGINAALIITTWGTDIQKSKKYSKTIGVSEHVYWHRPVSEPLLVQYMQASDLVYDQFELGVLGLISIKAMSCGRPLLSSYDQDVNAWAFPESPPVISCYNSEEIFQKSLTLLTDQAQRQKLSLESRTWVVKHHGQQTIVNKLKTIMDNIGIHQDEDVLAHVD